VVVVVFGVVSVEGGKASIKDTCPSPQTRVAFLRVWIALGSRHRKEHVRRCSSTRTAPHPLPPVPVPVLVSVLVLMLELGPQTQCLRSPLLPLPPPGPELELCRTSSALWQRYVFAFMSMFLLMSYIWWYGRR